MSISGRDMKRYLICAACCAVFSGIYEAFSHGVYSVYMLGLCLFPLLLGALPALILRLSRREAAHAARRLWAAGVATLAMGSALTGVFEIYGSPAPLNTLYWPVGAALLAAAAIAAFLPEKAKF